MALKYNERNLWWQIAVKETYNNSLVIGMAGANLTRASLSGASLIEANLTRANLEGANVSDTCILSIKAIGSIRGDNIYASPRYDDNGAQVGWGYHLGCYYTGNFIDAYNRIVDVYGEGTYSRCLEMLKKMCDMVYYTEGGE